MKTRKPTPTQTMMGAVSVIFTGERGEGGKEEKVTE